MASQFCFALYDNELAFILCGELLRCEEQGISAGPGVALDVERGTDVEGTGLSVGGKEKSSDSCVELFIGGKIGAFGGGATRSTAGLCRLCSCGVWGNRGVSECHHNDDTSQTDLSKDRSAPCSSFCWEYDAMDRRVSLGCVAAAIAGAIASDQLCPVV
eukprot:6206015-Pleurochrysis_carterae.AAC.4